MALMNIEESLDFAAADRFLLVRFFFKKILQHTWKRLFTKQDLT